MEEGSHRDIPRIDKQAPPGGLLSLLPDQARQPRVSSLRGMAAPRLGNPVGKKVGMEIMGEQDSQFPARIRLDGRASGKDRLETEQNGQTDQGTVSFHRTPLPKQKLKMITRFTRVHWNSGWILHTRPDKCKHWITLNTPLNTQNPSSYTPAAKKEVLINSINLHRSAASF
jgi:hypothetical protein